jgi:hypothetical protein
MADLYSMEKLTNIRSYINGQLDIQPRTSFIAEISIPRKILYDLLFNVEQAIILQNLRENIKS